MSDLDPDKINEAQVTLLIQIKYRTQQQIEACVSRLHNSLSMAGFRLMDDTLFRVRVNGEEAEFAVGELLPCQIAEQGAEEGAEQT